MDIHMYWNECFENYQEPRQSKATQDQASQEKTLRRLGM